MPLLHSRLIKWHVSILVNSIDMTSAEQEAEQQLFSPRQAEQSTQYGPIIGAAFNCNLSNLNIESLMVTKNRFIVPVTVNLQGCMEDSEPRVQGRLGNLLSYIDGWLVLHGGALATIKVLV